MALEVYWYDTVCFAIVGLATLLSLYVLWRNEGFSRGAQTKSSTLHEGFFASLGSGVSHASSVQLWATCWRGIHPVWLLGIRVLSFCVLAAFLAWDIQQWGLSIFMYYTEWTFSLVMVYFAIGSVVSAHGCWLLYVDRTCIGDVERSEIRGHLQDNTTLTTDTSGFNNKGYVPLQSYRLQEPTSQRAGFWGYLMQIMYQTCAGAAVLTDVVFWCIIVPFVSSSHLHLNLLTGCMHTLNLGCLLIDTCVNRLPFPWFRLAYFVLWSSIYIVFQWLIHLCGFTWWPYPFLELSSPWAPLWYLILAAFLVACYGLYSLFIKLKNSLFSELFPNTYVGLS